MNLSDLLFHGSRIAIVGSRDFPCPSLVESFVSDLDDVIVISGSDWERWKRGGSVNSCGGIVDLTAVDAAHRCGLEVFQYPPDWRRYRGGAGPVRNSALVAGGLDVLVAFAYCPGCLSSGTADVIKKAVIARVPVFVLALMVQKCLKKLSPCRCNYFKNL